MHDSELALQVHTDLTKLGGDVEALSAQQANASEGIYLLCRSVLSHALALDPWTIGLWL